MYFINLPKFDILMILLVLMAKYTIKLVRIYECSYHGQSLRIFQYKQNQLHIHLGM